MTPDEYQRAFERIPLKIFEELPDCFMCHAANGAQVRVEKWQNFHGPAADKRREEHLEELRNAFSPNRNINMRSLPQRPSKP